MERTFVFLLLFLSSHSIAQQKTVNEIYGQWHTTHGIDNFPCMNKPELEYFEKLINIEKNEQKKEILAQHRKQVRPSPRMPASVNPKAITKSNFICPPFRGVRNPHPQVYDFGKASTFERVRFSQKDMHILNGLSQNQKWPLHFNSQKGYFEGTTAVGTPMNIIPMVPPPGEKVRFVVQYLLWKDKTPPSLTLCYREDLHRQCNPYAKPGSQQPQSAKLAKGAMPAAAAGVSTHKAAD
jgi:hypothetical protein